MKKLLILFIAVCTAVSCSQYKYESVAGDPLHTRIYTLDNGLKVYMTVNNEEPRIQTYIAVKVGAKNDPEETTGLAHYFEHLMFKGTDKFGTQDYEAEKPMLDEIERLYEVYRATDNDDERKAIYAQIDSVSQEASKIAMTQRVRQADVRNLGRGFKRMDLVRRDGLHRGHTLEPDRELGQDPERAFQECRYPRLPHRAGDRI